MGKLSIGQVRDELLRDFQDTWGMPDLSLLSVDGNMLGKVPFLKAFAIIVAILIDPEEVMNGLRRLETAMLSHIPVNPLAKLHGYAKKKQRKTSTRSDRLLPERWHPEAKGPRKLACESVRSYGTSAQV